MMEDWYAHIEDYNLGKLPVPLLEQFETAMANDSLLAQAVAQHRTEWEAAELLAEKVLRAQVREQFGDIHNKSKAGFIKNWQWLLLLFLVFSAATVLLIKYSKPDTPQEEPGLNQDSVKDSVAKVPTPGFALENSDSIAAETNLPKVPVRKSAPKIRALALAAYQIPAGLTQLRSAGEGDTLSLAQDAFANKDYRLVLQYLASLPPDSRQEGLSLRGHAHFLLGAYAEASKDFSALQAGGVYLREAQWFGLLADMAQQDTYKKGSSVRLDAIRTDKHHPWQKDAQALWNKLVQQ